MSLRPLLRILAHHETIYISEAVTEEAQAIEEVIKEIDEINIENSQLVDKFESSNNAL